MIPGAHIPHVRRGHYATDFGEYAVGTLKDAQGWDLVTAGTDWTMGIVASAVSLSGKRIESDKDTTNEANTLIWTRVASVADVEVLGLFRALDIIGSSDRTWGFLMARTAADGDPYYIALPSRVSNVKKFEIGEGDGAGGGAALDRVDKAFTTAENWWIRFRLVGTAIKGKMWQYQTAEPVAWDIEVTDATIASGRVALSSFFEDCNYACLWISVATGGNTAPSPGG